MQLVAKPKYYTLDTMVAVWSSMAVVLTKITTNIISSIHKYNINSNIIIGTIE